MRNPLKIDLFPLEKDARFRAACLHFLQLANTYIVQIFFQTFNDGKRRRQLYEWLNRDSIRNNDQWKKGKKISPELYRNIVPSEKGRSGYLDAYDRDFTTLLRLMSDERAGCRHAADRFFRNLNHFHAIPLKREEFFRMLDRLRNKRNWLKDFDRRSQRNGNRPDDTEVIRYLGLLLLPKLHQHFTGVVSRALARARRAGTENPEIDTRAMEHHFRRARKERAEATERIFGARKRGKIDRKQRRDMEQAKQAFREHYKALYPKGAGPRYSYQQFRIRLAFIGKVNLGRLKKLLGAPEGKLHFSRDIEPLYNTAMAMNNILDEAFWLMARADGEERKRLRDEEGLSKKKAKERMGSCACLQGDVRGLRNHVAHNGLFCFYRPDRKENEDGSRNRESPFLPVHELFATVFRALMRQHNPHWREQVNELCNRIRTVLEKQDYAWVFERSSERENNNPPHVVRRWTVEKREKYLNFDKWRLDRRKYVRTICAQWKNDVEKARKEVLREGHGR